ncbi:MAG: M48 family metallopeptidase [Bacteroidota bacterium]
MWSVKPVLFIMMLMVAGFSGFAQLNAIYSFQKDDTLLRKNYADQSVKKKAVLLSSVGKEHAKEYTKIYDEQFEEIGKLWQSTRPVTSPEAHGYLQSLVQRIIASNTELKGTDARIIFSRDWWPNAVSMGDGTIAINAGLMVYLDNEAELVFVICHELSHYYLQHTQKSIRKYVETVTGTDYQAELKRLSKEVYGANSQLEKLARLTAFSSRKHSRDNEAEADRQAFIFMKKTGYDCNAITSCLQILDKVDSIQLYKKPDLQQIFNFAGYPFKKKWIQKESSIFSEVDETTSVTAKERDSLKTHPDCTKRIAWLTDSVTKASVLMPGKKFLVNETLFNQLKKAFFIEITEECHREKKLSRNLYYNLILLQANETNALATWSVARCLNEMYEQQKAHKIGLMLDAESKGYPEDYNLLLRMLARIRLEEIANLSYRFCTQNLASMKDYPGFEQEMVKAKNNLEE